MAISVCRVLLLLLLLADVWYAAKYMGFTGQQLFFCDMQLIFIQGY